MNQNQIQLGEFFKGLYTYCINQGYNKQGATVIVYDTKKIFINSGVNLEDKISADELGHMIFSNTKQHEIREGTPNIVREQRDYTGSIIGEAIFKKEYSDMATN